MRQSIKKRTVSGRKHTAKTSKRTSASPQRGFKKKKRRMQKTSEHWPLVPFNRRRVIIDLKPEPFGPKEVKATRLLLGASQSVFARFLGVSVRTIRGWEQGVNFPGGIARRFMDEIRRHPNHMRRRLRDSVQFRKKAGAK